MGQTQIYVWENQEYENEQLKPVAKDSPAISGHKFEVWFFDRALIQGCPQVPFVLLQNHHHDLKVTSSAMEL